jgi:hypothetical protein
MAFEMSPIGKKKCSYSPMQKKGLISPMLKEGEKPKSRVGQAIENFKTRNELTSYTKGDPDKPTVVVTTKKKARKVEKKAKKAEEKASKPKSSKSKSSKYKPAKVKTPKAKYGIGKGKKGFQKKRKN